MPPAAPRDTLPADPAASDPPDPRPVERDHVDQILEQWQRERPDIDVSGMAIIGRLHRLDRAIAPLIDTVFDRHGLETWEFDVLATLLRNGAPHQLTPGALIDSMMITSGAMTNRIDRLERRGLVERHKNELDGRQVLVTLTAAGKTTVSAALVDHAANERSIIEVLEPAERAQLTELLRTMYRGVAALTRSSG